ncbi:DUF4372 domain-containing protein [Bacteroides faecis]|uniref:DUF4372 domain-containing protein n=1 Tax=Bacteroides faecis TaxID=674529 RepID=UPI0032F036F2
MNSKNVSTNIKGNYKTKKFTCRDQFIVISYAQFTRSSSLRVYQTTFCSVRLGK